MADVLGFAHVNDFLGNVHGVIGDAFEALHDDQFLIKIVSRPLTVMLPAACAEVAKARESARTECIVSMS